jgi:hypothetical protein
MGKSVRNNGNTNGLDFDAAFDQAVTEPPGEEKPKKGKSPEKKVESAKVGFDFDAAFDTAVKKKEEPTVGANTGTGTTNTSPSKSSSLSAEKKNEAPSPFTFKREVKNGGLSRLSQELRGQRNFENKKLTEDDVDVLATTKFGTDKGLDNVAASSAAKKYFISAHNGEKESDLINRITPFLPQDSPELSQSILNGDVNSLNNYKADYFAGIDKKIGEVENPAAIQSANYGKGVPISLTEEQQEYVDKLRSDREEAESVFSRYAQNALVNKRINLLMAEGTEAGLSPGMLAKEVGKEIEQQVLPNKYFQQREEVYQQFKTFPLLQKEAGEKIKDLPERFQKDIEGRLKTMKDNQLYAKENIEYDRENIGLDAILQNISMKANDLISKGIANKDTDLLQKGNDLLDRYTQFKTEKDNLLDKYPDVGIAQTAQILSDRISSAKGMRPVFISNSDIAKAAAEEEKTTGKFMEKYGKFINYVNPTSLPKGGLMGGIELGLESIGQRWFGGDSDVEEVVRSYNPALKTTAQAGGQPIKIAYDNEGKAYREMENENYQTWDFNNSMRVVGQGLPSLAEFILLERGIGGLAGLAGSAGVGTLSKVAQISSKVSKASVTAEELAATREALKFSQGLKNTLGLTGAMYVTSYDHNRQLADELIEGTSGQDEFKKDVLANALTLLSVGAFKAVGYSPSKAVQRSFAKGIAPDAMALLEREGLEGLGKEETNKLFKDIILPKAQAAVKSLGVSLKGGVTGAGAVVLDENMKGLLGSIVNPEKGKLPTAQEDIDAAISQVMLMTAVGLPGMVMAKTKSTLTKDALYEAGLRSPQFEGFINKEVENGRYTREQANEMISIIKTMGEEAYKAQSETTENGLPLTVKQKRDLAYNNFKVRASKMLEEKGHNVKSGSVESEVTKENNEIKKNPRFEEVNVETDTEGNITVVEKNKATDETPEQTIINKANQDKLGVYSTMVKSDPKLAVDVLRDVAQQMYGVNDKGEPLEGGSRRGGLSLQFDTDIMEAAEKKFPTPESTLIRENTTAENNIPSFEKDETHEQIMKRGKTGEPITFSAYRIENSDAKPTGTGVFFADKGVTEEYKRRHDTNFYGDEGKESRLFSGNINKYEVSFENPKIVRSKEAFVKELAENGDKEAQDVLPNYKEDQIHKLQTTHETHAELDEFVARKARELGYDGIIDPLEYIALSDKAYKKIETKKQSNEKESIQTGQESGEEGRSQESGSQEALREQSDVNSTGAAETSETQAAPLSEKPRVRVTAEEMQAKQPTFEEGGKPPISEPPSPSRVYVERPNTELSHRGLQNVANEFSLPEVKTRERKTDTELRQEARETVDDWAEKGEYGKKVEGLVEKAEKGEVLTDRERVILEGHLANISQEVREMAVTDPSYDAKLAEIKRLKDAGEKTRSEAGAALRVPGGGSRPRDITDFMVEEMDATKTNKLTEQQKETVQKEFNEISEAEKAYEEKLQVLRNENAKMRAELEVKNAAKSTRSKGQKKDYSKERQEIFTSIKDKLKKARGDTSVTVVPYAKELFAIAPDVAKLVKSYAEQGIVELAEMVKKVHEDLKESIPEIQENDVRDMIAGNYNERKPTRNKLAETLRDLRDEAKLLNKYEALLRGEEPKSEKGKIERNRQIKELREKIKDFQDSGKEAEKAKTDAEAETKRLEKEFENEKNREEKNRLRAKIAESKRVEKELSKKTPEEIALSSSKSRMKSQIEKIEAQIQSGDFSVPEKTTVKLDKEGQELQAKLIKLKNERELRMLKEEYAASSKWNKIQTNAVNVLGVPRTLMASVDFSSILRQALLPSVSHPAMATKAAAEMFKSAFSKNNYENWFFELENSDRYKLMKDSKLGISEINNPKLSAKEEQYMNGLAEKIPFLGKLIKGSERAYVQYLNKMRVDLFNRFTDQMQKDGRTFENSKDAYKQMAAYVNNMTGRGDLGKTMNEAAPLLNQLFFSPRLMASRINTLTYLAQPRFYNKVPPEVRKDYFRSLASTAGLGLTVLALAKMGGADTESDPRSPDFGKIKSGNTRWDIWGGHQQYIRLMAQMITGQKKSSTSGKISEIGTSNPYSGTRGGLGLDFLRGKLAPVPSVAVDILSGENTIGKKLTTDWRGSNKEIGMGEYLADHLLPLTATGLNDAIKDQGQKAWFTVGIPSVFGVGTQSYQPKK